MTTKPVNKRKPVTRKRRRRISAIAADAATYGILVVGCLLAVAPILWGVLTSVKQSADVLAYPPRFFPWPLTLENYVAIFSLPSTLDYFFNSFVLAIGTIVLAVATALPAAFAAARFDFRAKNGIMFGILAMSMVPGISILIPIYILASKLWLVNSFPYMILVYSAWMVPQAVWFIKGFIEVLPRDLDEAALIDGCSYFGILTRIIIPLIRPGIAAISVLIFMFVWNDYLVNAVLASAENSRTVQVALVRYTQNTVGVSWGQFMAFATLAIAPVLILFLIMQRSFVEGLASGSVKG
jgi:ABC-type glycerol-3-phosphate transport system permease component